MIKVLAFMFFFYSVYSQVLEGFVLSGNKSDITDFSYSALLNVYACYRSDGGIDRWLCGASILNQKILLTAAHCVYSCSIHSSMIVRIGNRDMVKADARFVQKFKANTCYDEVLCECDIALLMVLSPLELSGAVGRIGIYFRKSVPYDEEGLVAGWGYIDEPQESFPSNLQHTTQEIIKHDKCQDILKKKIPRGTICGAGLDDKNYIVDGDSGSALVVRQYIQVGLVSFKPTLSSIVVYTDVGYYYYWIKENAPLLYCDHPLISTQ